MYMRMKKRSCIVLLFILAILLTGCNETDVNLLVNSSSSRGQDTGREMEQAEMGVTDWLHNGIPELWYYTCSVCKRWAPVVIIGCILLGILLIEIFKTNKEIQKFAWTVLILKVPLVVFLFVYMYSFLYGVFNL